MRAVKVFSVLGLVLLLSAAAGSAIGRADLPAAASGAPERLASTLEALAQARPGDSASQLAAALQIAPAAEGSAARANLVSGAQAWTQLASDEAPLAKTVGIAQARDQAVAGMLGLDAAAPTPLRHELPSRAVLEMLDVYGALPSAQVREELLALDALPQGERIALARVIEAFTDLELAARASPAAALAARSVLMDASVELSEALRNPQPATSTSSSIDYPPFFAIDPVGDSRTYIANYALLIDLGGNDVYANNAGGSVIGDCDLPGYAAALIDLGGLGDFDSFGTFPDGSWTGDACGKNGGAEGPGAVGFLLNDGSFATYGNSGWGPTWGFDRGVNGGATGPGALGALIDASWSATFSAGQDGVNGGATNGGVGLLVATGDAEFYADGWGANGGAAGGGVGTLVGQDHIEAWSGGGVNGGAYGSGSVGLLVSEGGSFVSYGGYGANGGAYGSGSAGALVAAGGSFAVYGDEGVNGGASWGGQGALVEVGLFSSFFGQSGGVNGGASGSESRGYVFSAGAYAVDGGSNGVNGGGYDRGVGLFVASGLMDTSYEGGWGGVNGGGSQGGSGTLVDAHGEDDEYHAGDVGVNGGAPPGGSAGLLYDGFGNSDHFHDNNYLCDNPPTCTQLSKEGSSSGNLLDF